jgi:hypothetical protein
MAGVFNPVLWLGNPSMRSYVLLAALFVLGFAVVEAGANPIAPPPPPPPPVAFGVRDAELIVEIDEAAKGPRLQIPLKLLTAQQRKGANAGQLPTLVAGLALTFAFVSGGFWLVRRGRARILGGVLFALSLLAATGSAVLADRPAPPRPRTIPVTLPAELEFKGNIVLEIVPNGDKIKLVVPKPMVKKSAETE